LNSPIYRSRRKALAPSTVVIPASRSSSGKRPCQVPSSAVDVCCQQHPRQRPPRTPPRVRPPPVPFPHQPGSLQRLLHRRVTQTDAVLFAEYRSLIRRIVRSVTPAISAASSQLIFFAIAFRITSCNFIVRSIAAALTDPEFVNPQHRRHLSGQITC